MSGERRPNNDATNPFPLEPGRYREVSRKQTNKGRTQNNPRRNDGSHRKTETPRHTHRKRNHNVGNNGHDHHHNHNRNRQPPSSMKRQRETSREYCRERSGEFTGFVSPEEQEKMDNTDGSSRATTATLKGSSFSSKSTVVTSDSSLDNSMSCLVWQSPKRSVPVEAEEALLPVLLHWKGSERGMMAHQPQFRLTKIRKACRDGVDLIQALSLRRHHMKLLNPYASMTALGLGNPNDIQDAAELFERSVANYLTACKISFRTEHDQKKAHKSAPYRPGQKTQSKGFVPQPPTPDFLLSTPARLEKQFIDPTTSTKMKDHQPPKVIKTLASVHVNWIEAKMFFGASTIPDGTTNAVGAILKTASKYRSLYGPGAFCFSYGCGEQLEERLRELDIVVLDAHPLDLTPVEAHQRRWCGDTNGLILP